MTNESTACLIDTNLLIYPHDPRDSEKQQRALLVLDTLIEQERAVLSVQCLTEFFRVATRRLPDPMSAVDALAQIERFAHSCRVLNLTRSVVLEACRGCVEHQLSIWDALIWAVAKMNEVPFVVTEDSRHDRILDGVHFVNPFDADFDLRWLDDTR